MPKEKGGKKNQAEYVESLALKAAAPIIESRGYKLWDVVYEKEGAMWYLKILFDKPDGGIDDTECEEITAPINEAVDKLPCLDLIDVLEVGSPGLDRVLRKPEHFAQSLGKPVKITAKDANNKEVYFSGTLESYDENSGEISLICEDGEKTFAVGKCRRIALDLI